ncbi:MAG: peptidoglycan-binding protein [Rhizobiales bacterium]|nr:peptidoglycan-binding protein [Hyphomicrobiales bacterium]
MARSARRPERLPKRGGGRAAAVAAAAGGMVARNPLLVGGSTAFLVALSFVSANALWYQPFVHEGAFFATRTIARPAAPRVVSETTIRFERPDPVPPALQGDPVTKAVQTVLKDLKLYEGDVDGVPGPNTRRAVATYQKTVGLPVTGAIDARLLEQLDTNPTAAIPPKPRPDPKAGAARQPAAARFDGADSTAADRIRRVQAGLREFGKTDIGIDGIIGNRTRAAIKEFQAMFGLKQTGEVDDALYEKMRKERYIR